MKGSWNKTTWMVRGEHDLNDRVMAYLSHATGWKSGVLQDGMGFGALDDGTGNLDFSRNNALLQDPEEVASTELGVNARSTACSTTSPRTASRWSSPPRTSRCGPPSSTSVCCPTTRWR